MSRSMSHVRLPLSVWRKIADFFDQRATEPEAEVVTRTQKGVQFPHFLETILFAGIVERMTPRMKAPVQGMGYNQSNK